MTDSALTPSQEAREAAVDITVVAEMRPMLREGRFDSHCYVRAFARFEQAIRKDEAEKCADVLEQRYRELMADGCVKAAEEIWPMIDAIRARHEKENAND